MRLADDEPLAKAVEARVRFHRPVLEIAFDDDGYDGKHSDWSDCLSEVNVEYSLDSSLPDSAQVVQGASMGTMKVTLNGRRKGDKLEAHQTFNPYRGDSPIYGYKVLDVPIRLSSVVQTNDGDRNVREFTGFIRSVSIDQAEGTVELDCWDILQWTQRNITLPRVALRNYLDAYNYHAAVASTPWFIDRVLRENSIYAGPKPAPGCFASWTLAGGYVAEVGQVGGSPLSMPDFSSGEDPAGTAWDVIEDKWVDGRYGLAANRPSTYPLQLECMPQFIPASPATSIYTIGMSFWIRTDNIGDQFQIACTWGGKPYFEKMIFVSAKQSGNTFALMLENDDSGGSWNTTYTLPDDDEWHFVALTTTMGGSDTAKLSVYIDDEWTVEHDTGTVQNLDHSEENPRAGTGQAIVKLDAPLQYVQMWEQEGSYRDAELPKDPPEQDYPRPDLGTGLQLMINFPEIVDKSGWELIRDVVNSEYGIVYTTEDNGIKFRNRAELNTLYGFGSADEDPVTPKIVRTISVDDFDNITIQTNVDTVRNDISYKTRSRLCKLSIAYKSDDPDYFVVAANDEEGFSGPDGDGMPLGDDVAFVDRLSNGTNPVWDLDSDATSLPDTWPAFAATNVNNVNQKATSGVSVAVGQGEDWRRMSVNVRNDNSFPIKLAFPTDQSAGGAALQPGLSISGMLLYDAQERSHDVRVTDKDSIEKYRPRQFDMGTDDWLQSPASGEYIARYLLNALREPTPITDDIVIPHDPRLQIGDAVAFTDRFGSGSTLTAAISGKTVGWDNDGGFIDTLTVKFLVQQNQWILGDAQRSILGSSTELGRKQGV